MKKKKILPPTFFMSTILIIVFAHFLFPLWDFIFFPWNLVGVFFLILGAILNLLADRDFKHFNTTVKPFEYSSKLITDGVFSFSRNPMYLGMVFILLGESILFGSLSPFLIIIVFMLLLFFVFIKVEEEMLLEKFDEEFTAYKNKVRCWL